MHWLLYMEDKTLDTLHSHKTSFFQVFLYLIKDWSFKFWIWLNAYTYAFRVKGLSDVVIRSPIRVPIGLWLGCEKPDLIEGIVLHGTDEIMQLRTSILIVDCQLQLRLDNYVASQILAINIMHCLHGPMENWVLVNQWQTKKVLVSTLADRVRPGIGFRRFDAWHECRFHLRPSGSLAPPNHHGWLWPSQIGWISAASKSCSPYSTLPLRMKISFQPSTQKIAATDDSFGTSGSWRGGRAELDARVLHCSCACM